MSCYTQRQCAHLWSARTRTFQCSSIANRMLCVLSQPEVLITKLSLEQTFISSLKNNEYIFWIFRLNLQMAMVTIKTFWFEIQDVCRRDRVWSARNEAWSEKQQIFFFGWIIKELTFKKINDDYFVMNIFMWKFWNVN